MFRPAVMASTAAALLALSGLSCGGAAAPAAELPAESPSPEAVAQAVEPAPAPAPLPPLSVDLHVDTVTAMLEREIPWTDPSLEASLPALLESGVDVVVQAAWIPRRDPDPRGTALGKVRRIRNMVRQSQGRAAVVTGPEQLEQVVREGRLAVVIALEGGTALTEGEETLRELTDLGLSMVGLTWTESSAYADSSAEPRSGEAAGLTPAGERMVALCNDLGLMLDVSHMSDLATKQTVELSRAPVLASHSNARSLANVPRNLTDEQLRSIASRGGLVGVMFHGPFVRAGGKTSRSDVVKQVKFLVGLLGAEHVGLGSDWDGKIQSPEGLQGSRDLPRLREELLAAGLSEEQVRQVYGDGFLRFWKDVRAARSSP